METVNVTTEAFEEFEDGIKNGTDEEVPDFTDEEHFVLEMLACATLLTYTVFVIMACALKPFRKKDTETYLLLKHLVFGLLHQTCIILSFIFHKEIILKDLLEELRNYVRLILPFWTLTVSINTFTIVILSKETFSIKQLITFCYSSVTVIQMLEESIVYILNDDSDKEGERLSEAVGAAFIIIIISVSLLIFLFVLCYSLCSPSHSSRFLSVLLPLNIMMLSIFDIVGISLTVISFLERILFKLLMSLALCVGLILEVCWLILYNYWKISISGTVLNIIVESV